MKCSIKGCPGEYEPSVITRTLRQDGRVAVIDHVPAEVCSVCGDNIVAAEVTRL
jgi:YgiT-type zinc finger domain-containing protein